MAPDFDSVEAYKKYIYRTGSFNNYFKKRRLVLSYPNWDAMIQLVLIDIFNTGYTMGAEGKSFSKSDTNKKAYELMYDIFEFRDPEKYLKDQGIKLTRNSDENEVLVMKDICTRAFQVGRKDKPRRSFDED